MQFPIHISNLLWPY